MLSRNHDPRLLLLLVTVLPLASWISGAIVIWLFWNRWWGVSLGIGVIVVGFRLGVFLPKLINSIFGVCFRQTLAETESADWVAVLMEKTETHGSLCVLPHTTGVVLRKNQSVELVKLDGEVILLDVNNLNFKYVSKTNIACSILVTDSDNSDVIGYVIEPRYKGSIEKIACHGDLTFQWFLEWIGVGSDENPIQSVQNLIDFLSREAVDIARKDYTTDLDYSPESIESVDRILAQLYQTYKGEPETEELQGLASAFGAYIGECIRREYSGASWDQDHPVMGDKSYPLHWLGGESFPCSWCYKRIVNGPEDNVWHKYMLVKQSAEESTSANREPPSGSR